jgi:5-(carboxyamino)imidazole ribonucleotide mutase
VSWTTQEPRIGVVMGSRSDLAYMEAARQVLTELGLPHEVKIVSAHRTPGWMVEYARAAERRGLRAIIAGAGGAAHLPGMLAANTLVPVLGVPIPSTALQGLDALLSIVQMPRGVAVGTLAIGAAGAANAALLAAQFLAGEDAELRERLRRRRREAAEAVLAEVDA